MANREIERYTTRAYTTEENVNVTEEHLTIPLRREILGKPLDAKDVCEFDLVTFGKDGGTPVFWVRESAQNQSEDRFLQRYVYTTAVGEMNANRLTPEDLTVYIERKNENVSRMPFYTPPLGEGDCRNKPEETASKKEIDEACKINLGCKENLATQHVHMQDISKEELFDKPQQAGKLSEAQLWQKLGALEQEKKK